MKYKKMNIYFRRGKYIWQKKKIFNIIRISFRWQKIIIQFLKKPNFIYKLDNKNISSGSNPSARAPRRAVQAPGSDGQRRRSIYYEGRKNSQGNIPTSAWPPFWSVSPWVMRWFSQTKAGDVGIFQNHQELPSEFAWKYTEKYTDLEKYPPRLRRSSRRNRPTLARLALSADRHPQSASQFRDAGASTQAQFLVYFDGSLRKKVRPPHKKNHLQQLNSLNYESFTIIKTGLAESNFSKKIVELNNLKKRTFGHNFLFRIQNILNSYTKCSQGPEYVIKYQLTKNIIYRALGPSPVITKFWNQDIYRLLGLASFRAKRLAPEGPTKLVPSLWARGPSAWPQSWISPLSVSSDIPTRPLKPSGGLTERNQQLRLPQKAKLASPKSKVHSLSRWTLLTFPPEGHRTLSLGVLGGRRYRLQKSDPIYQNIWFQNFNKSNQNTYFLQRPISFPFQWIQKGDLLSDCSSSLKGELALGKNLLVAYMPWEGFNFEDAVLINDKVLSKYTSLHIEKYDLEIAESSLEKITYNIPGISPKNLQKLDKNGVVQIGSWVTEGDILVGRIIPMAPFTQNLLTHEKLLYDIVVFGQKDRQIQERCLRVPQGVSGRIIRISYTHQQKDPISHKKNFFETMLNFQSLFNFEKFNNELGVPIEGHQRQLKFAPLSTPKIYSKNGLNSFKKFMKERAELGPQAQCNELFEIYRQNLWGYSARKHTQNRSALRPSGPSAPLAPAGFAPSAERTGLKASFRAVRSADGAEGLGPGLNGLRPRGLSPTQRGPGLVRRAADRRQRGQALDRHPFFFKQNQFRKQSQTKLLKIKENKPIQTGPEGQQEQSYVTSKPQAQAATQPRAWPLHPPASLRDAQRWAGQPSASRCQGPSARANKSIVFSSNNNYNFSQQNRLTTEATRLEGPSPLRNPPPQQTPPPLFLNSLKKITIYIAEKREFQIGDKISGRHGNKGIISQIFSNSDMPYLSNGCTLDVLLNPLGVPSRMNVGQILECLLGFTGQIFHTKFRVLCFDEIYGYESSRSFIYSKLFELCKKTRQKLFLSKKTPGKFNLFDGRNGQLFYQSITVGSTYLMKLIHVVDEKIHARGTGPYSLITQQPLRGRAKHGGQRIGEMEVWALQGFGSAYTLQELLTVKSDDLHGRNQIMQTLLKNTPLRFGTPESLRVVLRELQCLCLDLQLSDTQ